jgi:hypothetical protein
MKHARLQSCKDRGQNKLLSIYSSIETFLETGLNFATLQSAVRETPRSRKRSTVKSASLSGWLTLELRKDDLDARSQTTCQDSNSRNGGGRSELVALESRKHARFAIDLTLRVETLVKTSKRRQNAEIAYLAASNTLIAGTVKRTRSVARDLAEYVVSALNLERRAPHRNVEAPIINRLLTRKSLMVKGLEVALHARCKEGSV